MNGVYLCRIDGGNMTSAENNQLIADVARHILAQTAPEELPLFRVSRSLRRRRTRPWYLPVIVL